MFITDILKLADSKSVTQVWKQLQTMHLSDASRNRALKFKIASDTITMLLYRINTRSEHKNKPQFK